MMSNAQKMIEERKKALAMKTLNMPTPGVGANMMKILGTPPVRLPTMGLLQQDTASRIAQLQVRLLSSNNEIIFR